MNLKSILEFLVCGLAIVPMLGAGASPARPVPQLEHVTAGGGPISADELKERTDAFFAEAMEQYRIPGAAIVVVRGGEILLSQGYGYADLERRIAFTPDTTIIRGKSISKLFTATAAMQLAEQGQLDLRTDVLEYLPGFPLHRRFPGDVTMTHLLTHTSGFVDRDIRTMARTAETLMPLESYLAERMPPQMFPPGDRVSYTDHGISLAGYVVEVVSGEPLDRYIDDRILRPLDMQHSSFAQPASEALSSALATGYAIVDGAPEPIVNVGYWNVAPAVALQTTAVDVAHFMIANLNGGAYGESRILGEATLQEMHRQQFTQHPQLPGLAYGFWEQAENGQRLLVHAGEGAGFANLLTLVPAENVGVFITSNLDDFQLHASYVSEFLDHYFPASAAAEQPSPLADFATRAPRFAGSYQWYRHSKRSIDKLDALGGDEQVWANEDGTISTTFKAGRFVEVEHLLFRNVDGEGMLAFREDASGRITHLFSDSWPYSYERLRWYDTGSFQFGLLAVTSLFFFTAIVSALVRLLRRGSAPTSHGSPASRGAWPLAGWLGGLNLFVTVALFLIAGGTPEGGIGESTYGMPPAQVALLVIPHLTAALTVAVAVLAALAWRHRWWGILGRTHYTLVAVAALAFVWFNIYWNLLGFRF